MTAAHAPTDDHHDAGLYEIRLHLGQTGLCKGEGIQLWHVAERQVLGG